MDSVHYIYSCVICISVCEVYCYTVELDVIHKCLIDSRWALNEFIIHTNSEELCWPVLCFTASTFTAGMEMGGFLEA